MNITIYGIRNCGTMKKAFAWLDASGLAYDFHDYKKAGITEAKLIAWCQRQGLGDRAQSCRHDLPRVAGRRQA